MDGVEARRNTSAAARRCAAVVLVAGMIAVAVSSSAAATRLSQESAKPPRGNGDRVRDRDCCTRGDAACWPSAAELSELEAALDPQLTRTLWWAGAGTTYPLAFPNYAAQPLYGEGASLRPLYVHSSVGGGDDDDDDDGACSRPANGSAFCKVVARNNPLDAWAPALVAWPATTAHVQTVIAFARRHQMCLCVAGSGHDYLNRHGCGVPDGLLVRTGLLKEMAWDPDDSRGFGHAAGTVTVGAGAVFHELHAAAAANGRMLASGWRPTVGVAGWTLGGGHGPFSPGLGLGVDQLVEATVVLANGSAVTVSTLDGNDGVPDLLWALRGGGGSAWGVVTAFTVKSHRLPPDGVTSAHANWTGNLCNDDDSQALFTLIDGMLAWAAERDRAWGGYIHIKPASAGGPDCSFTWSIEVAYWYLGGSTAPAFETAWAALVSMEPSPVAQGVTTHPDVWSHVREWPLGIIERIYTFPYLVPNGDSYGGLPSVLVPRGAVESGALGTLLRARIDDCLAGVLCPTQAIYQCLTGNHGSPQDPDVAVSPGMRSALFHLLSSTEWPADVVDNGYYALGNHSYFGESAYEMADWPARLWGDQVFARLSAIKARVDPDGVFWCRHCVGDV